MFFAKVFFCMTMAMMFNMVVMLNRSMFLLFIVCHNLFSLEVGNAGKRTKFFKMFKAVTLMRQLRDQTFRIINSSKGNGICRAGLGAGSGEFTIDDFTAFRFCLVLCLVNALDAEGTFFHDTLAANGHIGVELIGQWFR